jgi:acetyltransferase-like isoleucine patch superfamily enzyme
MNCLKYLRPKYILGLCRLALIVFAHRRNIRFDSLRVYIGVSTNFETLGRLRIGSNCYFSKHGDIFVGKGASVVIGENCFFNKNFAIGARASIAIGPYCSFGPNVVIYDHDHEFLPLAIPHRNLGFLSKEITIGRNVWVCANATICKGVAIGDNVIVAANSVVTRDVPSNSVVAGAPVKILKSLG